VLWEIDRHEPLSALPWDEALARAGIQELAWDAERAFSVEDLWPPHPLDGVESATEKTCFYLGASGVAWALAQLRRRGAIETQRDWIAEARLFVDIYAAASDGHVPSLMIGEVGVRMVADADHDRLYELIASNIRNEALEPLWGAAGTMVPALILFERTGEARWRELYLRNAEFLLETFAHHDDFDVWMWTQQLYGESVRLMGAAHGLAGNVFALLRGAAVLSSDQRAIVVDRTVHTLKVTAQHSGELVNWLPHVGRPRRGREKTLVQWCHGAPGMIAALTRLPANAEIDALFAAGGELTWQAGPPVKGSGLCHGTAGNGYAFLAMHARTGEVVWLDRARRFAMHALEQTRAARAHYGRGRYSLWTGDLGVAIFLQDCIDGVGELPGLAYL
jgi:hypothetical protein